jgi:preprotein translocase subunit SecG
MTTQPTLAAIPGILLRTILHTIARVTFALALVFVGLTLFLATWRSARTSKQQAAVDVLLALIGAWHEWD